MPSIEFTTNSGKDPSRSFELAADAMKVTVGDLALAGQLIRSDIRESTAKGYDVYGSQFAPYSTKGPDYYSPSRAGGKFARVDDKKAKSAAARLVRKLDQGSLSSTGRTIKFASYAAFKAAFGRTNVDLQGVVAPHMLDAIVVSVDGHPMRDSGGSQKATTATVTVGIYGEEAKRASGHNFGTRTLPRRKFFAISDRVYKRIGEVLLDRIGTRVRRAFGSNVVDPSTASSLFPDVEF